ncbi:MAG TPA: ABC transporter permease [Brevefilum fermentans]|jgi:lipopolysaccharide transport system permease protein|uniref:Transport permease protein n=1 Tax=Candidatus Brevifilum fermentans TaxID=1986204 RepID=A0A1Y6K6A1_9CHLR|nr:ABC transporter permease [Brevefilum fermentans]MDI9565372.1 ABC transporter permease [Chloroflexota bacterium]OQB87866.1 MAG: Polysialic acid transport protein KpsM [Chloroflexi bacterium ADurb.Bin120]SMX55211.1 putative polysaccharide ABC transporter permease protein [Brevefilum fermentans]HOM67793.1 ABC transporter permease [Brevefilum fermentans]HPX95789.1 ABC transporter permease [Brevefilum fermentans]
MENTQLQKNHTPVTYLKPSKGWLSIDLKELWRYRELVYFLTWRDIKVRYKQAVLGIAWAVLQPVLTVLIFTVVFGILLKTPSQDLPYPLFTISALLPWQLFANALQRSSISLVGNANLLTKIYFPRLAIPLSAVMAALVDFGVSFFVLIGMMAYYRYMPGWNMLWLPVIILFALLTALAVGLWLSAINVQYRDVQHMVPFIVQVWMYASPIVYPIDIIPEGIWRVLYGLNPMVGVIQSYRWALLGGDQPDATMWISVLVVIILLVSGLFYFRRMEKTFADIV